MSFELNDYVDVAARIVEFRERHPKGSLQRHGDLDFREVGGKWWVIYTAAAYRYPEDERPGMGTAWEPIPGRTPYTKDSEVQNAETAAWGRAIVAALAADTKKGGVASREEVRNAQGRREAGRQPPTAAELVAAAEKAPSNEELNQIARTAVASLSADDLNEVKAAVTVRRAELAEVKA